MKIFLFISSCGYSTGQVASIAVLEAKRLPLPSPKLKMVRMKKLLSTIKDYRDQEGRQLSIAFNKLHSKLVS